MIENEITTLTEQFDEFMRSNYQRNITLFGEFTEIYIRKQQVPARPNHLCIGRVDIIAEEMRGKGIFTRLLQHFESNIGELQGIEVECIHNPRLTEYLDRSGYTFPSFKSEYLREIEVHRYLDKSDFKNFNPEAN